MLPTLVGEHEFVHMFLDEVRLVRAIQHPNVVHVYDAGEQAGTMWMAMEWVEGESLHSIIREAGKRHAIPTEIAVRIIADLAAGLHAAHELRDARGLPLNLVHRDVSPQNVLISTTGQVKLVDFGVAKALDRISEKTRTGHLKGKFGYMSPEQILGRNVDRRSDVFSLGIVLYELTTGRRLFRGKNEMHTLELVTKARVEPPSRVDPDFPAHLESILMKALALRAEDRYPTAAELELALRSYLKSECILVPQSGVASLLKRVVGGAIEQRRRALRTAMKSCTSAEARPPLSSARQDPASIHCMAADDPTGSDPTGSRAHDLDSRNPTSGISSLSQVSPVTRGSPALAAAAATRRWRDVAIVVWLLASAFAYFTYRNKLQTTVFRSITPPQLAASGQALPQAASAKSSAPELQPPALSEIPLIRIEELQTETREAERRP
jgi:serine/threonine-protein kinase